ncbi:hypothetical protein THOM_1260 [Trachipleistophora hominis]|uniref:Uncharacterized protein n=1 Tax=Trachipleistophora hominis TaxID=72359 RepID=L7JWK0_TRAHO|nr:hypothetical protein THOM_1260 [Trachipleistophora hominis]
MKNIMEMYFIIILLLLLQLIHGTNETNMNDKNHGDILLKKDSTDSFSGKDENISIWQELIGALTDLVKDVKEITDKSRKLIELSKKDPFETNFKLTNGNLSQFFRVLYSKYQINQNMIYLEEKVHTVVFKQELNNLCAYICRDNLETVAMEITCLLTILDALYISYTGINSMDQAFIENFSQKTMEIAFKVAGIKLLPNIVEISNEKWDLIVKLLITLDDMKSKLLQVFKKWEVDLNRLDEQELSRVDILIIMSFVKEDLKNFELETVNSASSSYFIINDYQSTPDTAALYRDNSLEFMAQLNLQTNIQNIIRMSLNGSIENNEQMSRRFDGNSRTGFLSTENMLEPQRSYEFSCSITSNPVTCEYKGHGDQLQPSKKRAKYDNSCELSSLKTFNISSHHAESCDQDQPVLPSSSYQCVEMEEDPWYH